MSNGGRRRPSLDLRRQTLPSRSSLPIRSGIVPIRTGDYPFKVSDVIDAMSRRGSSPSQQPAGRSRFRLGTSSAARRDLTPARPEELVTVRRTGDSRIMLKPAAAAALRRLTDAAREAGFSPPLLRPESGFRSIEHQLTLWNRALNRYGSDRIARRWVAPPGRSVHQTGNAVDLNLGMGISSRTAQEQRELPIHQWLRSNAPQFGFRPYGPEPWHWEYADEYFTEHSRPVWQQCIAPQGRLQSTAQTGSFVGREREQSHPDLFTEHSRPSWQQSVMRPDRQALDSGIQQTRSDYFTDQTALDRPQSLPPTRSRIQLSTPQSRADYFTERSRPLWPQSIPSTAQSRLVDHFTEHSRLSWPQSTAAHNPPLQARLPQSRPDYFTERSRPSWPQSGSASQTSRRAPRISPVQQSRPDFFPERFPPNSPPSRP